MIERETREQDEKARLIKEEIERKLADESLRLMR